MFTAISYEPRAMSHLVAFALIITAGVLGFGESVMAAVDLPWSTTYDCPDWNHYNDPLNCDGLSKGLGYACQDENLFEQITSVANYPSGGGGKGQRHWIGPGTNNNSGSLSIEFNSPQQEIWMRWYMRWEDAFSGGFHTWKCLYVHSTTQDMAFHVEYPDHGGLNIGTEACNPQCHYSCQNCGWGYAFHASGGVDGPSDGSWNCFELHLKRETPDQSDGIGQLWINGDLKIDRNNITYDFVPGIVSISVGSNTKDVDNTTCMYVDFDDIAISNTGYIGPIAQGDDTISPTISITLPTQGQTVSGNTTISANASDNVGVAGVQFKLDGANLGVEDTTSPYSIFWDTTTVSDGSYNLTATARDAAGNNATSIPVSVTVDNSGGATGTIFFQEDFEDTNFASRGWYDAPSGNLSTEEHIAGSTSSFECRFLSGANGCEGGSPARHLFPETDELYLSYYVKYSSNWEGSNQAYHPHEFYVVTNKDGTYVGPAYTHLTTYIEQNEGEPLLAIQDGQNIDESNINVDLIGVTENRSVAGCNGDSDGYGDGSCYSVGAYHYNGKSWRAGSVYFQDISGQYYKNDWHFIEAYFKLNSISSGVVITDGIIKYWYDGNLIIEHNDVVLRTGQYPDMKFNQFMIGPYIGDGSPVDQTFWVDNLTVATSRITTLKGDVTDDSSVNIQDIQACVNHILGTQDWGDAADVNGDEAVNVLDVQAIVNIVLTG